MATQQTEEWVVALMERDDAALATWAIEWLGLDLASVWEDLDDDARDWLVESGAVVEVEATVECTDAESWQSDWRTESNAAWPTYDLEVTAPGLDETLTVTGWHLVGPMGPDGNRRHEEWDTEDGDGCQTGLPCVRDWTLRAGDNMSGTQTVPVWRHEGRWVTMDREALGTDRYARGSLAEAASEADHGAAPTWEDVEWADVDDEIDSYYVLRAGEVVEVKVLHGGLAADDEGKCWAEAWTHGLTDDSKDTWSDVDSCVTALAELADDEKTHDTEDGARKALGKLVMDAHAAPGDLTVDMDDDGLYIEADDAGERYHPDADQLTRVYRHGWAVVMDDLTEALGVRETLAAAREWQEEMDAVLEERDPYVTMDDSLRGGNCKPVTEDFRRRLESHLGAVGELGAVRASVVLSLRDDAYTRRACRLAAQRFVESHAVC